MMHFQSCMHACSIAMVDDLSRSAVLPAVVQEELDAEASKIIASYNNIIVDLYYSHNNNLELHNSLVIYYGK